MTELFGMRSNFKGRINCEFFFRAFHKTQFQGDFMEHEILS